MDEPKSPRRAVALPLIFWKVAIPAASGGAIYLASELTHQPQEWSLILSAFVGGVTLVVQFLIDFDRTLRDLETNLESHTVGVDDIVRQGFLKIDAATGSYSAIAASPVGVEIRRLVQDATGLTGSPPEAVLRLARSEIERLAWLLRGIGEGQATYYGEDQEWLLALTRQATASIDATSTPAADGGGNTFEGGFWRSSLGRRYLAAQRDVADKGVVIRRLFILNKASLANNADFQNMCREQIAAKIKIRILDSPGDIPSLRDDSLLDFIIFDETVSYETIPATRLVPTEKPRISFTQLITRQSLIQEKCNLFEQLWAAGREVK